MGKISLYDRALGDYIVGVNLLEKASQDEVICDIAGYLLQQCVEKLLKYQIELRGDEFPWSHNISELLDEFSGNDNIPSWIVDNRETLTMYEAKTRYSSTKIASVTNLKEWYVKVKEYLDTLKPVHEECKFSTSKLFDEGG